MYLYLFFDSSKLVVFLLFPCPTKRSPEPRTGLIQSSPCLLCPVPTLFLSFCSPSGGFCGSKEVALQPTSLSLSNAQYLCWCVLSLSPSDYPSANINWSFEPDFWIISFGDWICSFVTINWLTLGLGVWSDNNFHFQILFFCSLFERWLLLHLKSVLLV